MHTPNQINLIKNAKNHFLLLKKLKNTESAQLCRVQYYASRRVFKSRLATTAQLYFASNVWMGDQSDYNERLIIYRITLVFREGRKASL